MSAFKSSSIVLASLLAQAACCSLAVAASSIPLGPTLDKKPAPPNTRLILERKAFRGNDTVYREYFLTPPKTGTDKKQAVVVVRTNDGEKITEQKLTYIISGCQYEGNTAHTMSLVDGAVEMGDTEEWGYYGEPAFKGKQYHIYKPIFIIGTEICRALDSGYEARMQEIKKENE